MSLQYNQIEIEYDKAANIYSLVKLGSCLTLDYLSYLVHLSHLMLIECSEQVFQITNMSNF